MPVRGVRPDPSAKRAETPAAKTGPNPPLALHRGTPPLNGQRCRATTSLYSLPNPCNEKGSATGADGHSTQSPLLSASLRPAQAVRRYMRPVVPPSVVVLFCKEALVARPPAASRPSHFGGSGTLRAGIHLATCPLRRRPLAVVASRRRGGRSVRMATGSPRAREAPEPGPVAAQLL